MLKISDIVFVVCFGLIFAVDEVHGAAAKQKVSDRSPGNSQIPRYTYVADQVVVKFKAEQVGKLVRKDDKDPLKTITAILKLPAGVKLSESMFGKWVRNEHKNKRREDPGVDWSRFMLLNLPAGLTPDKCIELLEHHPLVEYVEKQSIGSGGATYPDDEHAVYQWHIAGPTGSAGRIYMPEAWDITTGSSNVIVAVLDTGCDTNNVDFAGRIVPGWDYYNGDQDPADDHGHGTMVASVLCAIGSNFSYGAGIDWNCRLMPVKILNSSNSGSTEAMCADGIDFAVTNNAKIINLSASGWSDNTTMRTSISNALAKGVIFVTISYNYGTSFIPFPGSIPDVITVGSSDTNGNRCDFSDYGAGLDLVAPGTNMYAEGMNNSYYSNLWGTSFSAPQVAGVAALICSLRPELNNRQVSDLLCAGAENRSGLTNSWDQFVGWGVLNAYNSLVLAQTRLLEMSFTSGTNMLLSWSTPPNCSNRPPFNIEYASSLTGAWTCVSNITYGVTNAAWTDPDSANADTRFYRVKVRQF